jgi:hypothetical protein
VYFINQRANNWGFPNDFDKAAKTIQWRKDSLLKKWWWKKLNIHMQKHDKWTFT